MPCALASASSSRREPSAATTVAVRAVLAVSAVLDWLASRTAKLPRVELQPPETVIGRRTETCIQSGVFYQIVEAVDGVVGRSKNEWAKPDAYVVATGGFADIIGPHLVAIDEIQPYLTLYGLAMAGERISG